MKIIKLLIGSKQIKIKLCTGSIHKKFQIPVSIKNTKKSRESTRMKATIKVDNHYLKKKPILSIDIANVGT